MTSQRSQPTDPHPIPANEDEHDRFLVDEGLELLHAYRSIQSSEIRRLIRSMTSELARIPAG